MNNNKKRKVKKEIVNEVKEEEKREKEESKNYKISYKTIFVFIGLLLLEALFFYSGISREQSFTCKTSSEKEYYISIRDQGGFINFRDDGISYYECDIDNCRTDECVEKNCIKFINPKLNNECFTDGDVEKSANCVKDQLCK